MNFNRLHFCQSLTHLEQQLQQLQHSLDTMNQTNQQEMAQLRHLIHYLLIQQSTQPPREPIFPTNLPSSKTVQMLLRQQEKRLQERLQQLQRHSPLN